MKRMLSWIAFSVLFVCSAVAPGWVGASTLAASNEPAPDFPIWGVGVPGTFAIAESFTSTQAGPLESIELRFSANGPVPASIEIDLYSTGAGGIPVSVLGTGIISAPSLTSSLTWFSADFSSLGISLTNGGVYAIRARPGSAGGFSVGGSTTDSYLAGQAWSSTDGGATWSGSANAGSDLSFRVFVPEPTTAMLMALGLVGLGMGRRRRS